MRKLLNIFLTLLILLSTTGISISRHYCGNFLMSSAVIFEADACGEMGDMPMGCCHNEVDYFELQDDYQTTQISIDITPSFEITHFNYKEVSINLYAPFNKNISFVDPPSPPLIHGDTYKWVQSYLI